MQINETTEIWTYQTPVLRQANANLANQLYFVIGVSEDIVNANVVATVSNDSAAQNNATFSVGIGLDSTSVNATTTLNSELDNPGPETRIPIQSYWQGYPGIGRHFLAWLEQSFSTGGALTTTW